MATALVPMTNLASSYTIVTQSHPLIYNPIPQQQTSSQTLSPLRQFLKGEPKALGTVQIMTGVLMILFGIVLACYAQSISVYSGIVFWGALFHISAGALAVSASNKLNSCVVQGALVLNIFSTITAGISIILMFMDLVFYNSFRYCYYNSFYICNILESRNSGIIGVLLIFSLLQFCISIAVSAFTCKAICTNEPTPNFNVVPNPERCATVVSSSAPPLPPTQMDANMMHALAMGGPPANNPPPYCEKGRPDY